VERELNQAGIDLLKHFEGFRQGAYLDIVGKPTIGYGFTESVQLGDLISPQAAEERLKEEIAKFEKGIDCEGTENQIAALVCLSYNIGLGHFKTSTVRKKHIAGDFAGAADAFRMWNLAGGREVPGLIRRREAERALYLS
jgi:lysozyme